MQRDMSYSALGALGTKLQALIQKLKPGTRAREKALAMRYDLKVNIFMK
jgi:hypothetical protein